VLDALAKECVKATFFLVGRNAEALPALVKREIAEGHTNFARSVKPGIPSVRFFAI
jgi:peptidoglycan/xylan/chitin deacetylase (PgdA/CDA1 family)